LISVSLYERLINNSQEGKKITTAVAKLPFFTPTWYMLTVSGVTQDQSQQRVNLLQRLVVFMSLQEFIINLI
jgi:hypothetical protein